MALVAPDGPMYQAGTLSGNPLSTAAGLATLKKLQTPGTYQDLLTKTETLCKGLEDAAALAGVEITINRVNAMFTVFFHPGPVRNFQDAKAADHDAFKRFFHAMLKHGVSPAPSPYEAAFISTVHDDEAIETVLKAATEAFKEV